MRSKKAPFGRQQGWTRRGVSFEHVGHGVFGVAYKTHGGRGFMCGFATVERLVGEIVLHGVDHDGINLFAFLLLELIPCHDIPIADETKYFLVARHLDEQAS